MGTPAAEADHAARRPTTGKLGNSFPALTVSCEVILEGGGVPAVAGPSGPISVFPYEGGAETRREYDGSIHDPSPAERLSVGGRLREAPQGDEGQGACAFIKSDGGEYYWMPNAEYDRNTTAARSQVLADATGAVDTVTRQHEILVTEGPNGRTW